MRSLELTQEAQLHRRIIRMKGLVCIKLLNALIKLNKATVLIIPGVSLTPRTLRLGLEVANAPAMPQNSVQSYRQSEFQANDQEERLMLNIQSKAWVTRSKP